MKFKAMCLTTIGLIAMLGAQAHATPIKTISANDFEVGDEVPDSIGGISFTHLSISGREIQENRVTIDTFSSRAFDLATDDAVDGSFEANTFQRVSNGGSIGDFFVGEPLFGVVEVLRLNANRPLKYFELLGFENTGDSAEMWFLDSEQNVVGVETASTEEISVPPPSDGTFAVPYNQLTFSLEQDFVFQEVWITAFTQASIQSIGYSSARVSAPAPVFLLGLGLIGLVYSSSRRTR